MSAREATERYLARIREFDGKLRSVIEINPDALAIAAALTRGRYPPVNQARCSNLLLEHLEHLQETNDLFGNLAKSQNLRQTNVSTTAPCGILKGAMAIHSRR